MRYGSKEAHLLNRSNCSSILGTNNGLLQTSPTSNQLLISSEKPLIFLTSMTCTIRMLKSPHNTLSHAGYCAQVPKNKHTPFTVNGVSQKHRRSINIRHCISFKDSPGHSLTELFLTKQKSDMRAMLAH